MSKPNNIAKRYQQLQDINDWFSTANIEDVDEALQKYETAQKIVAELKKDLQALENTITKIKVDFE